MGNHLRYLSKPVTDCYSEKGFGNSYTYSAALMQGWRKHQEDRFVCIPDFYEGYGYFGIYDGHGGFEIAEFLRQKLHLEILAALRAQNDVELALHLGFLACDASILEPENMAALNEMVEEENKGGIASKILKHKKSPEESETSDDDQSQHAGPSKKICTENLSNATTSAETIIQDICQHIAGPSQESKSSKKDSKGMDIEKPIQYLLNDDIEPSDPEDEDYDFDEAEESSSTESDEESSSISVDEFFNSEPGYLSGSTATVAIVSGSRVFIANVGDSRCVLSRNREAIDLSLDHKPDDPRELARISLNGGSVSGDGRVNNCLNLSRAFGDYKFKGDSFIPTQQCITAEPYVTSIFIHDEDDFLVIASDGIWNSMDSQDVVDYIHVRLRDQDCNLEDICEELFQFILAPDSNNDGSGCDNMSCIIIKFQGDDAYFSRESVSNKVAAKSSAIEKEENFIKTSHETRQLSADGSSKNVSSPDKETIWNQDQNNAHITVHNSVKPIQYSGNIDKNELLLRLLKIDKNIYIKLLDYIANFRFSECWWVNGLSNYDLNDFLRQNHALLLK